MKRPNCVQHPIAGKEEGGRKQNIKLHDFYSISIFNLLNLLYASVRV